MFLRQVKTECFAKAFWSFGSLAPPAGTKLATKNVECDKSAGFTGFGFVTKRSASGRAKLEKEMSRPWRVAPFRSICTACLAKRETLAPVSLVSNHQLLLISHF
jgi:hypothetical protein